MSETAEKRAEPTPELLPCAFCGNQAVHSLNFQDPKNWHRFECEKRFDGCLMNARTHHHETEEQAAVAWNTRALRVLAPDTAAERDRLKVANAALAEALNDASAERIRAQTANAALAGALEQASRALQKNRIWDDAEDARAVLKAHGPAREGGSET